MVQTLPLRGGQADGRPLESFITVENSITVHMMAPKVYFDFSINFSVSHFEAFLIYKDQSKFKELETSARCMCYRMSSERVRC